MFSSLFSKAMELFGKSFILASFFPCLIVFLGFEYLMVENGFEFLIRGMIQAPNAGQVVPIVIFLFLIYLVAYLVYSLRDSIVSILSSGAIWIFPGIRQLRREHFISKLRTLGTRREEETKKLNAIVWAMRGFGDTEPDNVYVPSTKDPRLKKKIDRKIDRLRSRNGDFDPESTERKQEIALRDILQLMHQFSLTKDRDTLERWIKRIDGLFKNKREKFEAWCRRSIEAGLPELTDVWLPAWYYPKERYMQPTELGNVLSGIATYPRERYGIEMDFLFPLLLKVVDKNYFSQVEERKIFFDFAAVMTFLCIVFPFAVLGLAVALPANSISVVRLCIGLLCFIFAAFGFYRVMIVGARGYGVMLNGVTDLFRLKVLDELRISIPEKMEDERRIWEKLNESYINKSVPELHLKTTTQN